MSKHFGRGDFALPRTAIRGLVARIASVAENEIDRQLRLGYENFLTRIGTAKKETERAHAKETKGAQLGRSKLFALSIIALLYAGVVWAVNDFVGTAAAALVVALGIGAAFFWKQLERLLDKGLRLTTTSKSKLRDAKRASLVAELDSWTETFEDQLAPAVPLIAAECVASLKAHVASDRRAFLSTFSELRDRSTNIANEVTDALARYSDSWFAVHGAMSAWYVAFTENDEALLQAAENMKERCVQPALELFESRLDTLTEYTTEIRAIRFN